MAGARDAEPEREHAGASAVVRPRRDQSGRPGAAPIHISLSPPSSSGFKIPYAGFPMSQTLAQALRPFPQFTTIPVYWNPMGKTWYDALQVKVTQRFSHGLTAIGKFSWSKALTIGTEIGEPNPGTTGNAVVNNVFNRKQNKYISRYDQPFFFNMSLNYTTPRRQREQDPVLRCSPIGILARSFSTRADSRSRCQRAEQL